MSDRAMRVLVTGANGRLGRPVCARLAAAGYEVRGTDVRGRREEPGRLVVADLLNRDGCYGLVRGVDAVVHLGNHPREVLPDAQRLFMENVAMTTNVVQAAMDEGVRKLVFSSSVQVISGEPSGTEPDDGDGGLTCFLPYLPIDGDVPALPGNPYALSKQVGEGLLAYAARIADMQCIAIRFPWLVDEPPAMVRERVRGWSPSIQRRQVNEAFASLGLVDAAELVARVVAADLPGYRSYHPASREPLTDCPLQELLDGVYAGVPLRVKRSALRGLVDGSRIAKDTGWEPSA